MKVTFQVQFLFFLMLGAPFVTASGQVTKECPAADRINEKMSEANREYELKVKEYKQGLFCDKCHRSKSEIEKHENFEKHLVDVKGVAYSATPEMYEKARSEYERKFSELKSAFDSAKKRCEEERQREEEERRREIERKRREEEERLRKEKEERQREIERKRQEEEERLRKEKEEQQRQDEEAARKQKELEEQKIREAEEQIQKMEEERARYAAEMERSIQEMQKIVQNMLEDQKNARNQYYGGLFDAVKQDFSDYKNATVGAIENFYQTSKEYFNSDALEKTKEIFENVVLDDDDFLPEVIQKAKLIEHVWSGKISHNIVEIIGAVGFSKPLQFGQWGQIMTIHESLNGLVDDTIGLLGAFSEGRSLEEIEGRCEEVFSKFISSLGMGYVKNSFVPGIRGIVR